MGWWVYAKSGEKVACIEQLVPAWEGLVDCPIAIYDIVTVKSLEPDGQIPCGVMFTTEEYGDNCTFNPAKFRPVRTTKKAMKQFQKLVEKPKIPEDA